MGIKLLPGFPARRQLIVDCYYGSCERQVIRTHGEHAQPVGVTIFTEAARCGDVQLCYQCALKLALKVLFVPLHAGPYSDIHSPKWREMIWTRKKKQKQTA